MAWRRTAATLWIALALACAAFVGARFTDSSPLESNLLALLPPTERNPNAEAAVAALADAVGNRAVFLVGHHDPEQARSLARDFAAGLRSSGAFTRVIDQAPPIDLKALATAYAPYRAGLLTTADRARLENPDFDPEAALLQRLHRPFATGIATDPGLDPFGFFQNWLTRLPLAQTRLAIEGDMLIARDDSRAYVLVVGEPIGSSFDAATQSRVATAVDAAESKLRAAVPEALLLRTGGIFYGEAARRSAEAEVDLIGGGSLIGILVLLWLLFRSFQPLALGLATVAVGIACATAAILTSYGRIHLITLVFGASLIGEAIDYAIQYFAAHLDAGSLWEPLAGLKRVLPGLAIALATSLVGYGALTLTPFPAIGQIALFAFVGLAAAWIAVILLLPLWVRQPSRRPAEASLRLPHWLLERWREHMTPGRVALLAVSVVALSLPGWARLAADDDVRQLVARPATLIEEEATIRRLVGITGSGRFFLVEGSDAEAALTREEALADRLRGEVGRGIAGFVAVSEFVPSRATQGRNRELLATRLPPAPTAVALETAGFRDSAGKAWAFSLAPDQPPLTLATWQSSPLAIPFRHQILTAPDGGVALLVTLASDDSSLDLAQLAAGLPGVTPVDKAGSVSALFGQYRCLAARWLPAAIVIVLAILALRYGLRSGLAILAPTLLAMGTALAIYGYAGAPLTLFTLMGLVMVLGVGVNYAIFLVEARDRAPAPFAGVLLSAATTVLSFGLLALSSMPALHQFGLVMLGGISGAVFFAPMALTLRDRPCA